MNALLQLPSLVMASGRLSEDLFDSPPIVLVHDEHGLQRRIAWYLFLQENHN